MSRAPSADLKMKWMSSNKMNRKGQIGPQGMEDMPMSLMAFVVAVGAMVIFIGILSARASEAGAGDMHEAGKRLSDALAGDMFKSPESRSYGGSILDGELINGAWDSDPSLRDSFGYIEYGWWARIEAGKKKWDFGVSPPNSSLAYGGPVTILMGGVLESGKREVKIWNR